MTVMNPPAWLPAMFPMSPWSEQVMERFCLLLETHRPNPNVVAFHALQRLSFLVRQETFPPPASGLATQLFEQLWNTFGVS